MIRGMNKDNSGDPSNACMLSRKMRGSQQNKNHFKFEGKNFTKSFNTDRNFHSYYEQ